MDVRFACPYPCRFGQHSSQDHIDTQTIASVLRQTMQDRYWHFAPSHHLRLLSTAKIGVSQGVPTPGAGLEGSVTWCSSPSARELLLRR